MSQRKWSRKLQKFLRTVFQVNRQVYLPFIAGSLAYYSLISLLPVFTLILIVLSAVGGPTIATEVASLAESYFAPYLRPRGQILIADTFSGAVGGPSVSILSISILLWSAFRLFKGTRIAFTQIYGVSPELSLTRQLRDCILLFVVLEVALIVAVVAGAFRFIVRDAPLVDLISPLTLVVGFTMVFVPLYYVFPGIDVSVREVIPGAFIAAVGWTSLETLFRLYIYIAGMFQTSDLLSGVLLFVTWLYFSALVFLFGAVVNTAIRQEASENSHFDNQETK